MLYVTSMLTIEKDPSFIEKGIPWGYVDAQFPPEEAWRKEEFYAFARQELDALRISLADYDRKVVFGENPYVRYFKKYKKTYPVLQQLESEGRLTAKDLVDESRAEDAPLHEEFEWNDGIAAEKWREQQARVIISTIEVVSEEHEPVRAFVHLDVRKPEYTSIHTVVQSADSTQRMLDNAMRELAAFRRKYEALEGFAALFQVIDKMVKERKTA